MEESSGHITKDRFGFTVKPEHATKYLEYVSNYEMNHITDAACPFEKDSWPSMDQFSDMFSRRISSHNAELSVIVTNGLPIDLRAKAWQAFAGVKTRLNDGFYQDLIGRSGNISIKARRLRQIEEDVLITFSDHPSMDDSKRDSLRRLLLAYAVHNPDIGYFEGLNLFAGLLILMMDEENAFWTLVFFIDQCFGDCYSGGMVQAQVDQLLLKQLIKKISTTFSYFDRNKVDVIRITGGWFFYLFINNLPWESVFYMLDILLFSKCRTISFATTLELLQRIVNKVKFEGDMGDFLFQVQSVVSTTFDSCDFMLNAYYNSGITDSELEMMRQTLLPSVMQSTNEVMKNWSHVEFSPTFFSLLEMQILITEVNSLKEANRTATERIEALERELEESEDDRRLLTSKVEQQDTELAEKNREYHGSRRDEGWNNFEHKEAN